MHDPLAAAAEAVERDAMGGAIGLQGGEHLLGQGIGEGPGLGGGGHDVIHRGHGELGVAHPQAEVVQGREGLGAGDLMDEVQANEELGGASGQVGHPVQVPDFVVESAGAHGESRRVASSP